MSHRPVVYIADPYAPTAAQAALPTLAAIEANVHAAIRVGAFASRMGFAPLVPHAMGWLGVHGDRGEDADVRERAFATGVALARAVGAQGGELWVILREDGEMTAGTRVEHAAYLDGRGGGGRVRAARLAEWDVAVATGVMPG